MDRGQADVLIGKLGTRLGLPALALDGDGRVMLSIDGASGVVTVRHDADSGAFDLAAGLDGLEASPTRLDRALVLGFCWQQTAGAIFALDEQTGRLQLRRSYPGASLGIDELTAALETLITHAIAWAKVLGSMSDGEPPVSSGSHHSMPQGIRG